MGTITVKICRCLLSILILFFCCYMAWELAFGLGSFLGNPNSVLLHCDDLCTSPLVYCSYAFGFIVLAVGVLVGLRPPRGLGYFLVAACWFVVMGIVTFDIVGYTSDPRLYPYPNFPHLYLYKIRVDVIESIYFCLGICVAYLKGRMRFFGVIMHAVGFCLVWYLISLISEKIGFFVVV